ncbi:MAG: CDP-alcohol phosphatidyltransferase family protein, partial [Bacillota bacterium]
CLVELEMVPASVAIIIIGREFAVTGLRTLAAGENIIIVASKLGKFKTITQVVAISTLLLVDLPIPYLNSIGLVLLYFAVFMTIWSGVDYFFKARKLLKRMNTT